MNWFHRIVPLALYINLYQGCCLIHIGTEGRLLEYINLIFDNAHGHQRNAICDFVLALLATRGCCQAALTRFFDNFEAASRRLTRFLHNPRLDVAHLNSQTSRVLVAQLPLAGTSAFEQHMRKVRSRRRARSECSLIRVVAELIVKDRSCWDVLDPTAKLNLMSVS
ncbi:MAG TPA: hypothetical protein VHP35_00895 [Terriglobia bacterium]|nr:hypothetical protein [Terriglobia bacterium]